MLEHMNNALSNDIVACEVLPLNEMHSSTLACIRVGVTYITQVYIFTFGLSNDIFCKWYTAYLTQIKTLPNLIMNYNILKDHRKFNCMMYICNFYHSIIIQCTR